MTSMGYSFVEESIPYTGRELESGWVGKKTGLPGGDCAAAWVGPCRVETEDLVDLDDAREGAFIEAASMAHVIVEHARCTLQAAVLRQRLLVCILGEVLRERGITAVRDGDDLFVDGRKLTVSIAAPAGATQEHPAPSGGWLGTCLIHLGINVDPAGAPVPAVGLEELVVSPRELLETLLERYRRELATAAHAEIKVRSVP
jgi:hypothetical protein